MIVLKYKRNIIMVLQIAMDEKEKQKTEEQNRILLHNGYNVEHFFYVLHLNVALCESMHVTSVQSRRMQVYFPCLMIFIEQRNVINLQLELEELLLKYKRASKFFAVHLVHLENIFEFSVGVLLLTIPSLKWNKRLPIFPDFF